MRIQDREQDRFLGIEIVIERAARQTGRRPPDPRSRRACSPAAQTARRPRSGCRVECRRNSPSASAPSDVALFDSALARTAGRMPCSLTSAYRLPQAALDPARQVLRDPNPPPRPYPKNCLNGRSDYNIVLPLSKPSRTPGTNRRLSGGFCVTQQRVDAVVIGAGAGGLCAAARLAHAGLHTLVVDDKGRIGGRASTEEIDGFKVNIGAIAIEFGGVFEETFHTVGAPARHPRAGAGQFVLHRRQADRCRPRRLVAAAGATDQTGLAHPGKVRRRALRQSAGRAAIDRRLAEGLHQQCHRARPVPQPLRGDLCLQRRRTAGARLPHLFHQQGRLQALWLLPAKARSGCGIRWPR